MAGGEGHEPSLLDLLGLHTALHRANFSHLVGFGIQGGQGQQHELRAEDEKRGQRRRITEEDDIPPDQGLRALDLFAPKETSIAT